MRLKSLSCFSAFLSAFASLALAGATLKDLTLNGETVVPTGQTLTINGTLAGAGVTANLPTGQTLWVDAVNGNDGSALRGRADKPYLTIGAAKTHASSGDTIDIRPGTYDEKNLLKAGVYLHFEAGAVVQYTGTANGAIFDDGATGANAAVETKITGHGRFIYAGTSTAATVPYVFHITNSASHIDCVAEEAFQNTSIVTATDPAAIFQSAGYIKFFGHAIEANVASSGFTVAAAAVRWEGGDLDIETERILTTGLAYCIWPNNTAAAATAWIRCFRITGTNIQPFSLTGMDATARLNVSVQTLKSSTTTGNASILDQNGGICFLDAHRIVSSATGQSVLTVSGGEFHVRAFNIEDAGTSTGSATLTNSGGTSYLRADTVTHANSGTILKVSSGTCYVQNTTLLSNATSGLTRQVVNISGGTADLTACRISMATAKPPISVSGGTLNLRSCYIEAEATQDSIVGTATVGIYGHCYSTRAANAGITFSPLGAFTVASAMTVGTIAANTGITIGGVAVPTISSSSTLTNKTISGASNTLSSIGNSSLTNSAITIAGTSTSLGGTITQDTITGLGSTGIVKRTGANALAIATPSTDYSPATTVVAEVASTSGTAINFTSIPAGVTTITIFFDGVSTSGTSDLIVRLGGSGGIESTGYHSAAASPTINSYTTALVLNGSGVAATHFFYGCMTLRLRNVSANTWVSTHNIEREGTAGVIYGAGTKSTSTTLDRVQITTTGGTDTFDAGAISISYQ